MDISTELLHLIDKISNCETKRQASVTLLETLLRLFRMEQAAYCEIHDNQIQPTLALDSTRKVLKPNEDEIWFSKTLVNQALTTMKPALATNEYQLAQTNEPIPASISHYSIRIIICVPISQSPKQVIFMASQKDPARTITEAELEQLKIATQASMLALSQQKNFSELKHQNTELLNKLQKKPNFLYSSKVMEELIAEAKKLAPFNVSLFIDGESGVGKEELAKLIHQNSARKGKFIAVNCANLTETLLESELFGYTKGAFTGASTNKVGLLAEAEGGTFFLDEIGEMPINLQAKLLRVIQERKIRPLGSNKDIDIDVRFISASHKKLIEQAKLGKFRDDLFYRLQEMALHIEPLRKRKEDIEILAHHFINTFVNEFKMPARKLSTEALEKLTSHNWPGNIRELKNTCRSAVILSNDTNISPENIRIITHANTDKHVTTEEKQKTELDAGQDFNFNMNTFSGNLKDYSRKFENELIQHLLKDKKYTQAQVAEKLGVSVRTVQRNLNRDSTSVTI